MMLLILFASIFCPLVEEAKKKPLFMCTKTQGWTTMEPYFGLNYKMERSENFEDLLIYLDKSFVERKVAATLRSVEGIRENGDGTFTIHYSCMLASFELVFTPGVEFEEVKPDGQKVMSVIELEGNTIKHSQRDASGRTLHHVYEFTPETMTITTTGKGLDKAVKRYYKLKK